MAKALIAAVSLAVVLVAAVVVPLVFMPSISGFDDWPTAAPAAPKERVVTLSTPDRPQARAERKPRSSAPVKRATPTMPQQRLAQATPRPAVPTAVAGDQQHQPASTTPAAPAQPQAAPEAQPDPAIIDARDGAVIGDDVAAPIEHAAGLDGTNEP